jgi:hypothetical protein
MDKQTVTRFFKSVQSSLSKHSPEILTGLGIAGMITTTVLAVKATPKALNAIEAEKYRQNAELREEANEKGYEEYAQIDKLTPMETVKVAWKPYIPAAITGTVSIACLIGASAVNNRRNAALATAYQLSTTALNEYKKEVVETIGEKKEKAIREKVAQKKVDENPTATREVVITGNGNVLFLEPVSMRYFTSDIETIRRIVNDLNYRLTCGMEEYISLSEFYDEIGLSHTRVSDDLGWNIGKDGPLKIDMPPTTNDKGEPCLMLEYFVEPRRGFTNLL